ncbi:hypothetical protein B0H14DRAFT_3160260 [Mycena olivaceomarginata]|nr:hypothetical protein B0H14DRAFT_3160260 [Mycena olivaceomarginata]
MSVPLEQMSEAAEDWYLDGRKIPDLCEEWLWREDSKTEESDDKSVDGSSFSSGSSMSSDPFSDGYEHMVRVAGQVFTRIESNLRRVPYPYEKFVELVTCQGLPLVNKALALNALARLLSSDRTLLLRRPRGFGLSTFTSMLAARLDLNYLRDPFPLLTNGKWSRHGLHSYHVLHLDFADLGGSDVNQALLGCLYPAALDLVRRYKLNLTLPDMDYFRKAPYVIVSHLALKIRDVIRAPEPLFVIVDNYDAPATAFPQSLEALTLCITDFQASLWCKTIGGLALASYMDEASSGPYVGRSSHGCPLPPLLPLLLDIPPVLDITNHPVFQSAIGFTAQDVVDLDEAMRGLAAPEARPLLELVQESGLRPSLFSAPDRIRYRSGDPFQSVKRRLPDVPVHPWAQVGRPKRIFEAIQTIGDEDEAYDDVAYDEEVYGDEDYAAN